MKTSVSIRIWYAFVAVILWAGIYFTGFSTVSWVLYVPAIGFIVSAIIGICPSLLLARKLFGSRPADDRER